MKTEESDKMMSEKKLVTFSMVVMTEVELDPSNYDPTKSLAEQIQEECEDYKRFPEFMIRPNSVVVVTSEVS